MTITEAMRAVSDEYDAEMTRFASGDKTVRSLVTACLMEEYNEIDQELVGYVSQIAAGMGVPPGTTLPDYVYQMARMCFRIGMRTQRKIDHPDKVTSIFWRSDQAPV